MVDYIGAIKRPFSDGKKTSIAALLYMVPLFKIITQLFAGGWLLEVASSAMHKKAKLPDWKSWGDLFMKGLLASILAIIYSVPAGLAILVVGGSVLFAVVSSLLSGGGIPDLAGLVAGASIGLLVILILGIAAAYIMPSAILAYADKRRFTAGLDFGLVLRKAFTGKYVSAWAISMVYGVVVFMIAGSIASMLAITIVLPFVVLGFASAVWLVSAATMMGEAYSEIR